MTLKGQGHNYVDHRSTQMAPKDSLTYKHRSGHQNHHPKWFSSKVMVKDIFLHNGGQRNAFAYTACPMESNITFCIHLMFKPLKLPGVNIWQRFAHN